MNDSSPRQVPRDADVWIERVDGPAALIRPRPWRLVPNQALCALLEGTSPSSSWFQDSFRSGAGELFEALARGQPFHGRLRLDEVQQPEQERLLHTDLAPLPGRDDWLATFLDLSPLERTRTRRARTLARLEHTLDQLHELISMIDHEETVLFVNASWANFFGTTRAQAAGRPVIESLRDNYGPTDPPRRELFRTLKPVRFERMLIDARGEGRVMGILLWPILDAHGRLAKMATLTRDVTLRQRGLEALRQTLERLDALFEAGIEAILLCEDGVIIDANTVACRQIGLGRHQLVGQRLRWLLAELGAPDTVDFDVGNLYLSLCPGGDGAPPLQIQGINFIDEGRPCQAVLMQDMIYRFQAQQRIDRLVADLRWQTARAEAADRSKSVFLASASHDLRQPIHALGLLLTTIRSLSTRTPLHSEDVRPIVDRMRSSLDGLTELLNMLLGASLSESEQQPVSLRPTPLQGTFEAMLSEFGAPAARKGLSLRAVPTRAWVLTDPLVLRRIVTNLMSNAVRYTRKGRIVLGARNRGASVEIQVWDTGIGIPPGEIDAIFEEFVRVDASPLDEGRSEGLGLSIVRRAAAQLGARLDVRSQLGKGSMFSVLLPLCTAQLSDEPPVARPAPIAHRSRHILLIDDDEQVVVATTSLLESWGHVVLSAASASEAMRRSEEEAWQIDTVICDYMLDPSMDGLQLLLRLRSNHPGMPVCMVTGDMSADRLEQARQHGFTLLHKPVNAEELRVFLQGVD